MDRSMLCRKALVNLSLSGKFLALTETPLCEKLHIQHREPDFLCGVLKCTTKHLLEKPSTYFSLTSDRGLIAVALGSLEKSRPKRPLS